MCRSPPRTACGSGAAGTTTRSGSRPQNREEVERLVQVATAEAEIADRDRRREPVVEALRDSELGMQRVPACPDRQLVHAQLARVKQADELDISEGRLTQRAELLG